MRVIYFFTLLLGFMCASSSLVYMYPPESTRLAQYLSESPEGWSIELTNDFEEKLSNEHPIHMSHFKFRPEKYPEMVDYEEQFTKMKNDYVKENSVESFKKWAKYGNQNNQAYILLFSGIGIAFFSLVGLVRESKIRKLNKTIKEMGQAEISSV